MSTLRSTEWDLMNGSPLGNGSGRRFSAFDLEAFSTSALSPMHSLSLVKDTKSPSCGRMTGNPNPTLLLPTHIIRRGPKSDRSY